MPGSDVFSRGLRRAAKKLIRSVAAGPEFLHDLQKDFVGQRQSESFGCAGTHENHRSRHLKICFLSYPAYSSCLEIVRSEVRAIR